MVWKNYKTTPKNRRILVCYINLWGYNHVTEAYWCSNNHWPTTSAGTELKVPFLWSDVPEGPEFREFYEEVLK